MLDSDNTGLFYLFACFFFTLLFYSFFFFLNEGPGRGWGVEDWVSGLVYTLNVFVDRNFSFLSPISFLAKCSDNLIKCV